MKYEIYWDDLTEEAKDRLAGLNQGNEGIIPLAIIEIEDDDQMDFYQEETE